MSNSNLAFAFLSTGVAMFGHTNEYVLFICCNCTTILVRQDKNHDFKFLVLKEEGKMYLFMLPNNFSVVSGLKEVVALLKFMPMMIFLQLKWSPDFF